MVHFDNKNIKNNQDIKVSFKKEQSCTIMKRKTIMYTGSNPTQQHKAELHMYLLLFQNQSYTKHQNIILAQKVIFFPQPWLTCQTVCYCKDLIGLNM